MFVPGKLFQPRLMFACKTGAYKVRHFRVGSGPYPQILDRAVKASHRQTLKLITKIRKLQTKKFYNIDTCSCRVQLLVLDMTRVHSVAKGTAVVDFINILHA